MLKGLSTSGVACCSSSADIPSGALSTTQDRIQKLATSGLVGLSSVALVERSGLVWFKSGWMEVYRHLSVTRSLAKIIRPAEPQVLYWKDEMVGG